MRWWSGAMIGGLGSQQKKTQVVFFTRKRIEKGMKLKMYGKELDRVGAFTFLGVLFGSRLTWAGRIRRIEDKCYKPL